MNIYLFTFNKKVNSTSRPNINNGVLFECDIKSPASLLSPLLIIDGDVINYNYAYIPSWNRYYFINGITFDSGLWLLDLTVDVLASYKNDIGNYSGYILRSASTSDGAIIDDNYAMTTNITITKVSNGTDFSFTGFQNGTYVLGLQGMYGADTDGSVYYCLTPEQFKNVVNTFYANTGDTWWGNLSNGIRNSLNKIDDFIVSCRWYPVELYNDGVSHRIYLGSFNTGIDAPRAKFYPQQSHIETFTVPKHPKASARGSYLNYYPYTKYDFYDPLIGKVSLDPAVMKNLSSIRTSVSIDVTTGQAIYKIYYVETNVGERVIYQTAINIGTDISLDGATVNVLGLAGSVLQAGVSATTGNVLGVAGAIGNALVDAVPQPGSNRPSGGYAQFIDSTATLTGYFMDILDEDNTNNGRPLCKIRTINSLSGYMIVDKPHLTINGLAEEQDTINDYLSRGFYYE